MAWFQRGARGRRYMIRNGKRTRVRFGTPDPHIMLDNLEIADDAAVGDPVGTLSVAHSEAEYTFSLTDDAGGLFAIDGAAIEVAAALTAGVHQVTIEADDGVNDPLTKSYGIIVSEAA